MGLTEEIKELKELLKDDKVKEKKFKFPFTAKVSPARAKKNWITVIKVNENGNCNIIKKQIDEQTIMEDKIPRLASSQYVLHYKKNPLIILPSWSVEPYSPAERYKDSLNDGSNTAGYQILLNKMLKETVSDKKPIPNMLKWGIGLIVLAVIGYAIFTGGGA